jgi:hypothetical protein
VSDSAQNLRLDRRLARRRGWIAPEELERVLSELPDVSAKILPPEDEPMEAAAPSAQAASPGGGSADPAAGT